MALKYREELVGKRFLIVSGPAKLKLSKISEWEWRAGIVRAASHRDCKHPDLTVLVEFDDVDWKRREWIRVHEEGAFQVFLVEKTLGWALRKECPLAGGAKNLYWPSLNFKPVVDKAGLWSHKLKPVEYLVDKHLDFVEYSDLKTYQDADGDNQPASRDFPEVRKAIRQWTEFQDGQRILLTTPSVLVGYRVEVYRAEGTTQWYTAVIVSYNENTRELTLTDDTVLEGHNEDPCLVQMKLIGDGVVESILKGENVGITPRRRTCTLNTRHQSALSARTRSHTLQLSGSRLTAAAIAKKSRIARATPGELGSGSLPIPSLLATIKGSDAGKQENIGRPRLDRQRKISGSDSSSGGSIDSRSTGRKTRSQVFKLDDAQDVSLPQSRKPLKTKDFFEDLIPDGESFRDDLQNNLHFQCHSQSKTQLSTAHSDSLDGEHVKLFQEGLDCVTEGSVVDSEEETDSKTVVLPICTSQDLKNGSDLVQHTQELKNDNADSISSQQVSDKQLEKLTDIPAIATARINTDRVALLSTVSETTTGTTTSWIRSSPTSTVSSSSSCIVASTAVHASVVPTVLQNFNNGVVVSDSGVELQNSVTKLSTSGNAVLSTTDTGSSPLPTVSITGVQTPKIEQPQNSTLKPGTCGLVKCSAVVKISVQDQNHSSPLGGLAVTGSRSPVDRKESSCLSVNEVPKTEKTSTTGKVGHCIKQEQHDPVKTTGDNSAANASTSDTCSGSWNQQGLMHPAGLAHSAAAAAAAVYPQRLPSLPQHARSAGAPLPPTPLAPYGMSTPHLLPPHPVPAAAATTLEQHSIHQQAYRHILSQHPLLPPQYGSHVGLEMLWQKYPHLATPSPNPWVVAQAQAQYQEMRLERDRVMAQERDRHNRLERERREKLEHEKVERDKLEREKAEKKQERERQEREQKEMQERERLERSKQERERMEQEEQGRAQREAVQQHFEESLRLASQKMEPRPTKVLYSNLQRNMGWSSLTNLALPKPIPTAVTTGHGSPVVTVSQQARALGPSQVEVEKEKIREKAELEAKERFAAMEARMRQDSKRWLPQQTVEHSGQVSHTFLQHDSSSGSAKPKIEMPSVASHSSLKSTTTVTTSASTKSCVLASPMVSATTTTGSPIKSEPSFSLYGYQPFQHTYITQAQLKAREEGKISPSLPPGMYPGKQMGMPSSAVQPIHDKDHLPGGADRSGTPGSGRSSLPSNRPPSLSPKQNKMAHNPGQERSSPLYQPSVGSGGAFKPYEFTPCSPAPAHQNSSSPGLTGRGGTPHFSIPPQQDQPQNLVKTDSKNGARQTPQRYEAAVTCSPSVVLHSCTPPFATKSSVPPATSAYSYSLIQQGLVPNPMYTLSGSTAPTTAASLTTATTLSHAPLVPRSSSPSVVQTFPRAIPGPGITTGTPVCKPSCQPVEPQGRMSHVYSSVVTGTPPQGPASQNPTPLEAHTAGRPQVSSHRSPSPAQVYGNPLVSSPHSSLTASPQSVCKILPPSTSPRVTPVPSPAHYNPPPTGSLQPSRGSSPVVTLPPRPSSTPGQVQPLNLQSGLNSLAKRKPSKDNGNRKRPRVNEDMTQPPQHGLSTSSTLPNTPIVSSSHPGSMNTLPGGAATGDPFPLATSSSSVMQTPNRLATAQPSSIPSAVTSTEGGTLPSSSLPLTSQNLLNVGRNSGFLDSFRSFVTSQHAHLDSYHHYYDKHAKARHKARLGGISPPLSLEDSTKSTSPSAILPNVSASSSRSTTVGTPPDGTPVAQTVGNGHEPNPDTSRITSSPALSVNSLMSTGSATSGGGSSNHTKLKKAWLQRHSETEDKKNPTKGKTEPESKLASNVVNVSENSNHSTASSVTSNNSKGNNTSSLVECKSVSQVSSNGSVNDHSASSERSSVADDDMTTSASETEQEVKSAKQKTRTSRKRGSSGRDGTSKRQKVSTGSNCASNNDNSNDVPAEEGSSNNGGKAEKDDSKQKSLVRDKDVLVNSKRRGRKPKGRGGGSDDSHKKKSNKLFEKPSVARLKRTGEPFLQDGACCDVAPKLPKCRECRMTPHQRNKKMPNIFCRFYAFRKLRYSKSGTILSAGFSEPSDATEEDLKLWLPSSRNAPKDLDTETSKFLLAHVGDQFCDLVEQEKEAQSLHMSEDRTITWKRVVQGVREMCDVCETTLFNIHWVCHKCGFVVCLDCYKARKNGTVKEEDTPPKDRDEFQWLLCTSRQSHEQEKLMMTQIITGTALFDVGKMLHEVRKKWRIPNHCCSKKSEEPEGKRYTTNGICKQLMSAVSKCFTTDKNKLPVNGLSDSTRSTRKSGKGTVNGVSNLIKQEEGLSGYNLESGSSPLSWLADVALNSSGKLQDERHKNSSTIKEEEGAPKKLADDKNASDTDECGDDEKNENFSTLRELLIRPTGKGGGKGSGNGNPQTSRKTVTGTLDDVISCVIEQKMGRTDKKDHEEETQLLHFTRRYPSTRKGREPLPIRICTLAESMLLYPNVPHSWMANGKLLLLYEPHHEGNLRLFQEQWKRGQPIVVADVNKKLDMPLWHPDGFCLDFGDVRNDLVNCKTGAVLPDLPMRKFWEGFENFSKRMKDDDGDYMLLKLKDWPPGEDFSELLPSRFRDLMKVLPLPEYTHRNGVLNLAGRLPECFVRPDLGPKMYNAYGSALYPTKGTTNLHLDISDAVNVMVYVGIPKDGKDEEHIEEALKAIDEAGCDALMRKRVREKTAKPGALWHIYNARDADKIRDLLNKIAVERGEKLEPHHDPIHDQSWYLDRELRDRLYKEYHVEGYAIAQCLGDAVFIPAGAPHQVRNLHSCVKVAEDFVSPENIAHCFTLTQEFRQLSDTHTNHEDKLQIKNIIYHAVRDALSLLQTTAPEDSKK